MISQWHGPALKASAGSPGLLGLDPDDLGQRGSLFLFFQIVQYIWHYCARIDVESPSYVYETQKNEQTTVREEKFSLLPF